MERAAAEKIGLIVLVGLIVGSGIVVTRLGVGEIPALELVLLRLTLTTIAFALTLLVLKREMPTDARTWVDIAIVGITNAALPLIFFTLALQFISSAVVGIFLALTPLITGVIAHFWLAQEKLTRNRIVGLVVALVGVLILLLTGTNGLSEVATTDLRGQTLAFVGVVVGAASGVYAQQRLEKVDVFVLTGGQFAAALLVVTPLALYFNPLDLGAITPRGWIAIGYTGLIASFFGLLIFFYMIKRFGATIASLPNYLYPAVSASLGALILSEVISAPLIGGMILILFGVFITSR
jgi:drug/metabolite transporter (DMT)-like permease